MRVFYEGQLANLINYLIVPNALKKLVLLILLLNSIVVFAGRPLNVDDSFLVGLNVFEIELGYNNEKFWNHYNCNSLDLTLSYGIAKKCDIGLNFQYVDDKNEDFKGFSDINLELKYNFYSSKNKYLPNFSMSVNFQPSSSNYALNFIFSKDLKILTTHLNLGYEIIGNSENKGSGFFGLALEIPLIKRLSLASEYFIDRDFDSKEIVDGCFTVGIIYTIRDNINFDIGYLRDLEKKTVKDRLICGLTIDF